jgi:hypothetical protein
MSSSICSSRAAVRNLGRDHGYWPSTWRIYGKELT